MLKSLLKLFFLTLFGCCAFLNFGHAQTSSYTVGGTVNGLLSGKTVVLKNNTSTLLVTSSASSFTFPAQSAGTNWNVTVAIQPSGQTCTVTNPSGTNVSANVTNVSVNCEATFTVGGTVTGLTSGTLVLRMGTITLVVNNGATTFKFATGLKNATAYNVLAAIQPPGFQCSVGSGSGVISGGNISNVGVTCARTYTVGVAVIGLTGSGLTLKMNAITKVVTAGTTSFTFASALKTGTSYVVTILNQPAGQVCRVISGTGVIGASNVTNVEVKCGYTITVNKTGTGFGTVASSPAGIDCGVTCSATFEHGGSVVLTALEDINSTFIGWSGADASLCMGTVCVFNSLSAAKSVTATFTFNVYKVGGAISGLDSGQQVKLTLTTPSQAALSLSSNGSISDNEGSAYTIGWGFNLIDNKILTHLGAWTGGGAYGDIAIGLWNSTGSLLASITLLNSNLASYASDGDFQYAPLTSSILLNSGQYTVGAYYAGGVAASFGAPVTPINGLTFLTPSLVDFGISLTRPTIDLTADYPGGLIGPNLRLMNAAPEEITVYSNGFFNFETSLINQSVYDVTVTQQPAEQVCFVFNGSGTITWWNVTTVSVTCGSNQPYVTIGGAVSGLTSGSIDLLNNGENKITVFTNGAFQFSLPIANGSDYAVSVADQPNDLTCTVANGNGTATDDVTSVSVSCTPYSFIRRYLPEIYSTGKAINYSPYRTAGGPGILEVPTDAQILEDLGLLDEAGYNLLRLFGAAPPATDVVSEKILQLANQHYPHIKFQLGVFLGGVPDVIPVTCTNPDPTLDNSKNIAYLITKLSKYPNVVSISVGNETSFYSKYMPVECLGRYIKTIRAQVTQPVTADDDFTFYAGLSSAGGDRAGYKPDDILPLLDFAAIHMYPFSHSSWDWQQTSTVTGPARAQKTMETSLDVAKDWFNRVATYSFNDNGQTKTVAQAMPIVIGETGWKARQTNYSSALESYLAKPVNAKWYTDLLYGNAAKGYASWAGSANGPATIFYFQAFDETWKGTDDGWGLWNINRAPRYALCGLVSSVVCNADLYQGAGYYQTGTLSSCSASFCAINFSEPTVALVEFGGLGVEVVNDPTDANNKVGKLTKLTSSQVWAGATVHLNGAASTDTTVTRIDPAQGITLRVYSPAVGETIMVKIENGANSGVFKESSVTTTVANQWQTLTFTYPTADASAVYNKVSVFPAFLVNNAEKVFYIDELKYTEKTSSSSSSSSSSLAVPTTAPSTATPGGAVVVYSDASATAGFNANPNWGQATVYEGQLMVAGNNVLKYSNLNYQGMEFDGINVSAKTTLHVDFWTPNLTGIEISLISLGPTVENAIAKVLTPNAWNSIDIPLSSYSANKSAIRQIKLVATGGGTIYVDNIYFY